MQHSHNLRKLSIGSISRSLLFVYDQGDSSANKLGYAAKHKAPIILTGSSLSEQTGNYLKPRMMAEMAILGGETVIGKNIEQQVKQSVKR